VDFLIYFIAYSTRQPLSEVKKLSLEELQGWIAFLRKLTEIQPKSISVDSSEGHTFRFS